MVFTKKGCGTCRSVVTILRAKGVDFTEVDVATDVGLKLARDYGVTSSGAIVNEKGQIVPIDRFLAPQQSAPAACASCG